MKTVISVKFKDGGKVYYFDPGELDIQTGDGVIVETARGVEFADVVQGAHEVDDVQVVAALKRVERVADQTDRETRERNRAKEKEAYDICMDKITSHKLDMKLVDVEYTFNGSKVVFYFTADGRVDFRELVKDLASVFKTRIELRQIGVRDEAKMLGGLGSCGRPVCCQAFLADFQPVSIKMAKEQNLSLSPTKISGICGRLMCCLKYEQDCYESMRKQMPRVGRDVQSPDGEGVVLENNVITERTRIKLMLPDGTLDVRGYPFRELSVNGKRFGMQPTGPVPPAVQYPTQEKADFSEDPAYEQQQDQDVDSTQLPLEDDIPTDLV
ncbi:MAG: stage 0 sporulation family protein [Clostridia bacterium]